MAATEVGLIARAKGLACHLVPRQALETLAAAERLDAFVRSLLSLGAAIDSIDDPADVFAIDRAIGRTVSRHLRTLYRWQERRPGVLDLFAARQDRRSLRALLRGAAAGAPSEVRVRGLLPTPSLPQGALTGLANQPSPAAVVQQLVLLAHPDASRLLPFVQASQVDLLAIDAALLAGFADRARRLATHADATMRAFVCALIDAGNAENALLMVGEPAEIEPSTLFVRGGRWFPLAAFLAVARATSYPQSVTAVAAAIAGSPLAASPGVGASNVADVDRTFAVAMLEWLTRAARVDPLGTAPLLRALQLVEAQRRDLSALAWGAMLGTPPSVRIQQLVTPV